jgi:hypothetical protein
LQERRGVNAALLLFGPSKRVLSMAETTAYRPKRKGVGCALQARPSAPASASPTKEAIVSA